MGETYSFSDQIGIASIHATLRPVAANLKRWLVDGVQGLGPDSPALLDLAATHVSTVRLQVVQQFGEANASALPMLQQDATGLERFRGAPIPVLIVVAPLPEVLVAFILPVRRPAMAEGGGRERPR